MFKYCVRLRRVFGERRYRLVLEVRCATPETARKFAEAVGAPVPRKGAIVRAEVGTAAARAISLELGGEELAKASDRFGAAKGTRVRQADGEHCDAERIYSKLFPGEYVAGLRAPQTEKARKKFWEARPDVRRPGVRPESESGDSAS